MSKFKRGRSGFFIKGFFGTTFYDNHGKGHPANAHDIIEKNGWIKNYEKHKQKYSYEPDYLIYIKGAIQIGSATEQRRVLVSVKKYTKEDLREFMLNHNIEDYDYVMMEEPKF